MLPLRVFKIKFAVLKFCKYGTTSVTVFNICNNIFPKNYQRMEVLNNVVKRYLRFSQYCYLML